MDALSSTRVPGIVSAALRTWLRYLVPLTLLSAVALSPLLFLALTARVPAAATAAIALRKLSWELVALAVACQLLLVGGAAAVIGARLSQLRAFTRGLAALVRAILPCIAAVAAIAIGGLALVIPGLLLLPLVALTGASPERGVRARLLDSITAARKHLPAAALAVVALLALDVALGLVAHRLLLAPLPRQPSPAQLAAARHVVHALALALVAVSPLPATLLASIRRANA